MTTKTDLGELELPINSKSASDRYLENVVYPRIRNAYEEADRRDILDTMGGIHAHALAEITGCSRTVAKNWLRRLSKRGYMTETGGFGFDTDRPRRSYVPNEYADDDDWPQSQQ